jgi:hypothetical protein
MIDEKITAVISTDPKNMGADVDDDGKNEEPIVSIPLDKITPFEPASKMKISSSRKNMFNIAKAFRLGHKVEPILVRKSKDGYIVVDGHHRFFAAIIAGMKTIRAKILMPKNVEIKENTPLQSTQIGSPEWFSFMIDRVKS